MDSNAGRFRTTLVVIQSVLRFGQSINYCTKGIRHYFPQMCENVTEKEVRNKLEMLNERYTYLGKH